MTEQQRQDMRDGLNCLKVSDINELRSFKSPPVSVKKVLEAVMILLGETDLSWQNIQKVMKKSSFIQRLRDFDGKGYQKD